MSGLDEAAGTELTRLQRAVYGPGADADAALAQEQLRAWQSAVPPERPRPHREAALGPGSAPVAPSRNGASGAVARTLPSRRALSPGERVLWAGLGAVGVLALTIAGFFLGALTAPHPDRVLIPVVQADSAVVAHEDVTDYREFSADQMKIGIGTMSFDGPALFRCLYVGGARADLRSEALSGSCAPESDYGTTWEMSGDLGTGSSLFGLGAQDAIRFIERDSGLEVWLSQEPT